MVNDMALNERLALGLFYRIMIFMLVTYMFMFARTLEIHK